MKIYHSVNCLLVWTELSQRIIIKLKLPPLNIWDEQDASERHVSDHRLIKYRRLQIDPTGEVVSPYPPPQRIAFLEVLNLEQP